jgi:hypothetical protein
MHSPVAAKSTIQPVVTVSFLEMKIFFANDRYGADQSEPRLAGHGT